MPQNNEHTTRFKVDISNLKAGITEANRQIRLANAQFKAASAGMDDWGKSVDGVKSKINQLETVLQAENTKLRSLKQQLALTEQEYGANSTAAMELKIAIANQQAAVNRTERSLSNYRNTLTELENAQEDSADATEEQSNAYKDLKDTISKQESDLRSLREEYANMVLSQGESSDEARELANRISDLNDDLQSNRSNLAQAESAADGLTSSLDDVGDSAEDSSEGFTIMKGALADLVAEGISKAVEAFKDLITQSSEASASLQAQTGATSEEMKKLNKSIEKVYGNNFGENMQDVADAMAEVKKQSGDISTKELESLTENGMTLRDTFGYEIGEQMRAVNMLMSQFGLTSDEAFNFIVSGAQNGLDKNGDLLDSINEYGVHYSQMGMSADDFYNSLKNGTDAGTFSVDKLGDAVKEFGIRTKDTADSTTEGFELIGLDADKMREKFAAGGESAKSATDETLKALFDMDDQLAQNQAGVDLFGTMWEDLGVEGVKALMDVNGEAVTTSDAMKDLGETKYSDLTSELGSIGRKFQTEILQPIVDQIVPALESMASFILENFDTIAPIITGIAVAFGILATALAIETLINGVQKAFLALNTTMLANPIILIVAAIAGLIAAFVMLWNKSDAFREFWEGLWEGIKKVASVVVKAIGKFFSTAWDTIKKVWSAATKFFGDVWDGIKKIFSVVKDVLGDFFSGAWDKIKGVWNGATKFFSGIWDGIKKVFSVVTDVLGGFFSGAWDGIKKVWDGAKSFFSGIWSGIKKVFSTVGSWFGDVFSKAWSGIKKAFSNVKSFFTGIWDTITGIFGKVGTAIGDAFGGSIKSVVNTIIGFAEKTINTFIRAINTAIGIINKIPGVEISKISELDIPRLEKGGVLKRGQVGLLEGNGAEAVVPLENNKKWISKTARDLKASLQAEGLLGSGASAQNVTNNYNFTQNNTSPKALSRLDIYRQTRNQLNFAKGV